MTRRGLDVREAFEVAAGSVRGRIHTQSGRNNQDAYALVQERKALIGVVTDGCGSGAHSEVGAELGAVLAVRTLRRKLRGFLRGAPPWNAVLGILLDRVRRIARMLGGDPGAVVEEYLLFTLVGFVLTSRWSYVFSLGDGALVLNGETVMLGRAEDNRPCYLGSALLSSRRSETRDGFGFREWTRLPTGEVDSILVGTDGVSDLADCAARAIPGRSETVGPLSRFWEDDRMFLNPDVLRRKLALVGRDSIRRDRSGCGVRREAGLLPDDTTMMVVRRRPVLGRTNDADSNWR